MKKIVLIICSFFSFSLSFAQLIQASLGPGTHANSVKIYLKSAVSQAPANISTLQFNLAIDASIAPRAKMTVVSSAFPGVTWKVDEAVESGYNHYMVTTATSPIVFNIAANTEFEVMEVRFTNGPAVPNNVFLVSLPDGGTGPTNGNALFLATGSLRSIGSNLYFARSGVVVNNQLSYDNVGGGSGAAISTAMVGNIILPINWLGFTAVRQGNDALLSWNVDNDADNEKYIVERSVDGANFTPVGEVNKRAGTGAKKYELLDKNIVATGSRILYYRIKSVETNNRSSYTDIKNIRLDIRGDISLYPIPARDGFTLAIPYLNPNQQKVQLQLVNAIGQVIDRKDITRAAAANYYYNLQSSLFTSGEYLLKIFEDGQLSETKRVVIKK
ncbi:MAG TPA: T9SS type A sorting domain-containing protein [Flavisolibacter sp.]|nr:T9SS type A sorting domain-containing protein [Flavisolibacter sp.]